jgi:PAS domain S-box-containing protein
MAGSHEDITDRKRALEELAHERNLLRILMDTSPDAICFKDRDGRYVRVNRALAEKIGLHDAAEVLGKIDADYFAEEYVTQARADEREILRTGRPLAGKGEKQTWLDGRTTWVSTTKVAVCDPDGQCIGIFGVSREITER